MARRTEDDGGGEAQRLWRLSAMGTELAFGIVGMVLLGVFLDWWLGWSPWGVVVCTVLGVLAAGYNFIRQALALNRRSGVVRRSPGPPPPPSPPAQDEKAADDLEFPPDFDRY